MFIVALCTIAKTWKQPKCLSIDDWINKTLYIYIYIYDGILAKKSNEIMPFAATWMDVEIIIVSEVRP